MRKRACLSLLVAACTLASARMARAQGIAITHDPTIECFPVGKYTLVRAWFPEGARVARARTYFRRAKMPETWFYIEMQAIRPPAPAGEEGGTATSAPGAAGATWFEGGLPKPKDELLGEIIDYYVAGEGIDATTGQTQEYHGQVVRSIEECKKRPLLARRASPGNLPPGFAAGAAFPVAAVVVGAGAAGATGIIVATNDGGETPPVQQTPPPGPTPTPAPTPVATLPPPGVSVECTASPNSGNVPLTVNFTSTPGGGTGQFGFRWVFGDNKPDTSENFVQNPSHRYTEPGQYSTVVRVVSPPTEDPSAPRPGTFADCRRIITVREPPPPDPCAGDSPPTFEEVSPDSGEELCASNEQIFPSALPRDDNGIQSVVFSNFFITPSIIVVAFDPCVGTTSSTPTDTDVGTPDGDTFFGTLDVPETTDCQQACYDITFTATDTCGQSTTVKSTQVLVNGCCGIAVRGRRDDAVRRSIWTSDLGIEGGHGQVVINGSSAVSPRQGRSFATSPFIEGENRIEATLVASSGKPGTWRFEFAGADGIEPGTLKVVAGEVAFVSQNAVVFRLRGTPGERMVFTFKRK